MRKIFSTQDVVLTPYRDVWNANAYTRYEPFREQPWLVRANSTSAAPVVLDDLFFVGLLRECDAVFEWDGSTLNVEAPDDALFISTSADPSQRWAEYHQALGISFRGAPFGFLPEYCTWVEQMASGLNGGFQATLDALVPELIDGYMDCIKKSGWPVGRFTVDAGWSSFSEPGGFGDWLPLEGFNMPALAEKIRSNGHVPGLWMAPALIARDSRRATLHPDLVGEAVEMDGECEWTKYAYLTPSAQSQEVINDLFQRVFDWGFRKFKLDIFYGPKSLMQALSEQCRIAADRLPDRVELEGHIPDPFCAQYMDVLRINDLLISEKHPRWREVFDGHLMVCRASAPGLMLNLDHIGGNCVNVGEVDFISHLEAVKLNFDKGYPCLSLLPQHIGAEAVDAVTVALLDCAEKIDRSHTGGS